MIDYDYNVQWKLQKKSIKNSYSRTLPWSQAFGNDDIIYLPIITENMVSRSYDLSRFMVGVAKLDPFDGKKRCHGTVTDRWMPRDPSFVTSNGAGFRMHRRAAEQGHDMSRSRMLWVFSARFLCRPWPISHVSWGRNQLFSSSSDFLTVLVRHLVLFPCFSPVICASYPALLLSIRGTLRYPRWWRPIIFGSTHRDPVVTQETTEANFSSKWSICIPLQIFILVPWRTCENSE